MQRAKLLLVEDESDVLRVNAHYLKQLGYDVRCAGTLDEARNFIWELPPDLIVLDVLMPDGNGFDFCKSIREITSASIIFLTCLDDDRSVVAGLSGGGDDYIVKPYSLEVLGARIDAQLRRIDSRHGRIELPPLRLNLSAGSVEMEGEEIILSRKEFHLLVYFVENRGKVLTQEQLYAAVWEAPLETMGNTVKVTISRLRQKLKLGEASCFELSSVPSGGYLFLRVRYSPAD